MFSPTSAHLQWLLLLSAALLCLLVRPSLQDAAPEAAPAPAAEPKADASPDASFQFQGGAPHFGFLDGFGGPDIHGGARALSSSSHLVGGGEHSHCALLIPGHGKSSNFDHAFGGFNAIHGSRDDGVTCITFQSVDAAFSKARDHLGLPRPGKKDDAEVRSRLAEVLLETTRLIAKEYHLPKDVIVNGLPLIDTHKTIIGTVCSDFTRPGPCKVEKYRTISGRCNNLDNPTWGSSLSPFKRFLLPLYEDGVGKPKVHSKHGHELPSGRVISNHVHRDEGLHDHAITIMSIAWGQAMDHDMTLTAETKLPGSNGLLDPRCCDRDRNFPACFPIIVSGDDPFYSLFKQNCMSVTRSLAGLNPKCKLGPRTQVNEVPSYLDGNWIYGNDAHVANRLRLYKGGLLKALPVFREFGLKDMLPLRLEDPTVGCIRPNNDVFCFDAGDPRVNEQLVLTVVHTLLMREHNRIAIELSKINPHWDDEKLYQEGRHIVGAIIQHITYNEFLPMVLGKDTMQKHGIILNKHGYFDGYNPKVDASVTNQFITSAFRFGHSLLPSTIERWSTNHKYIASTRLSEMLQMPYDLYKGGWCDQYIMGLSNQVAQAMDDAVTQEVTNHLFQSPDKKFGMDLPAINMQRSRDHGVPYYNDYREFCGLPRISDWTELEGWMANRTVKRYSDVYRHPDDIDLWSGGVSERPMPGSLLGPTFNCLIALTFRDLRYGDRFWYENSGFPSSFTPHQLEEIRKVKLSRIVCDNSDDIKKIQVYAMVLPDHDINPRVPCNSGVLARIDLSKWADPHGHGQHANQHGLSGHHLQELDLPQGTRGHFNNPGSHEASGGSGAALNLLNVGPPLSGSNSLGGGNIGGGGDDFFHSVEAEFNVGKPNSFLENFASKPEEIHHFGGGSGGDDHHFDFGKPQHFGIAEHDDGIVPHHNVFHGHNEVQYGAPHGGGHHQQISTGYSDFAIGDFGPIKHDSVINQHFDGHHSSFGGGLSSYGPPPHHGGGGGFHSGPSFNHGSGFRPISPGHGGFKPISHGSVPYGVPHETYGPPPRPYGPPPIKPLVHHAVVIPLRPSHRPHSKGKGGKGGGGYFKKFMGMLGY